MIELIHGDCMLCMKDFEDNEFDLAIVDPPYGIYKETKSTGFLRKYETQKKAIAWDTAPGPEYFKELFRVSKNQIIFGAQYFAEYLPSFSQLIVWDKCTGDSYFADGEAAFCSIPGTLRIYRHQWCGAFKDSERGEKAILPAQKPVALYKWLLSRYAKPGYRILDTHGGSGSICIACHDLGYDLTWIEKSKKTYNIALSRVKEHIAQRDLFQPNYVSIGLNLFEVKE